ncbi:MAG TPA: MFS transporter [Phycisphaerae bacterium]|nr:MFS transporter [Phycisphaerae bacterium]
MRQGAHQTGLRRDLRASTIDGAAFSVNVGVGETYLPAFLLAIGGGEVASGLVATVPMLAGAVLQTVSPAAARRVGSLRRWVVLCATVQSLSFVPLIVAALLGTVPVWGVFLVAAVYWGSGMATGPAWNTWIGTVVPAGMRARFFARRSRVCQVALLTGLLIGGLLLQFGRQWDSPVRAFAVVFLIAAAARAVSAGYLRMQSEPRPLPASFRSVSALEFLGRLRTGRDSLLLLYLLAVTLTVQLAGPFFTPYMLGELRFSYTEYMTLIGAAFAAKILILPSLGGLAHRFGARRLLWTGGLTIVPLSALWLISDSFVYLLAIQLLAGCAWGAYELATFLLVFETIDEDERTSVLTLFNVANAALTVGGSLLGGLLLQTLGQDHAAYATVFAVSAIARGLTLLLLLRVAPVRLTIVPLVIRTLALRPSAGSLDAPIVVSIPPPQQTADHSHNPAERPADRAES